MARVDDRKEWMIEAGKRVPPCGLRDWFYSKFVTRRGYDDYPEPMPDVFLDSSSIAQHEELEHLEGLIGSDFVIIPNEEKWAHRK
ncbi:hypothetical protein CFBP498_44140 [Xanthomonas hortorum pv. vitians]|uniref:Uncharacterized protein n=1 Tax=Xanthomonas hortorum pv. vitians TaxID=83224 RepID=A0A6V7F9C3_9XANT|nr:hypothetical protein [Xanthomonas hortorum]MCE4301583.1 hypothetical protein [Xanthomonas hortorum pv. vitians]MDT7822578.1 hypothetical protein [Xanthomonas hortorum pv. vitians]MDV7248027.1 hypothetical protein [Xanthomonas hortorum pv. vitians]NMI29021.1 hypothetical protein [Xanthomonas hortorum pv. vitians]CAD0360121.1 hypothetical protein CFBP498_44140 [Xanthomonas hortorum pv. vitians]